MLPKLDCSLNDARAHTDGDRLIVTTGKVQRPGDGPAVVS
jgi:hypothetical protein